MAISVQLWRQRFQNMAILWIDILGNQVKDWTLRAVANDEVKGLHITLACVTVLLLFLQWTLLALDMLPGIDQSHGPSPSASPTTFEKSMAYSSWHHKSLANAQIVSSIRQSPFPSPPATDVGHSTRLNNRVRIGGGSGAFTPYDRNRRLPPKISPMVCLMCVCVCVCVCV